MIDSKDNANASAVSLAPKQQDYKVVVLIPCYQEELTVGKVVRDMREALPDADIYVFDNNSTDRTAAIARDAGAIVVKEKRQGKGYVVDSMFAKVDADYYIMIDGDDTYDTSDARKLLQPLIDDQADMVVANRLNSYDDKSFRSLHVAGNRLLLSIVNVIFKVNLKDIFSGYRAFTRKLVKTIPITSPGFDVETEMTVQVLYRGHIIKEIDSKYGIRPDGSESKLSTFSDGLRVIICMMLMIKSYKPLTCFLGAAVLMVLLGIAINLPGIFSRLASEPVEDNFFIFGCSVASALMAIVFTFTGLILHSINFRILQLEQTMSKAER